MLVAKDEGKLLQLERDENYCHGHAVLHDRHWGDAQPMPATKKAIRQSRIAFQDVSGGKGLLLKPAVGAVLKDLGDLATPDRNKWAEGRVFAGEG